MYSFFPHRAPSLPPRAEIPLRTEWGARPAPPLWRVHQQRIRSAVRLTRTRLPFRPVRKLLSQDRVWAQIIKCYDQPQTPYQRVVAAGVLSPAQRQALDAHIAALDPIALAADIQRTLGTLWKLADHRPAAPAEASRG